LGGLKLDNTLYTLASMLQEQRINRTLRRTALLLAILLVLLAGSIFLTDGSPHSNTESILSYYSPILVAIAIASLMWIIPCVAAFFLFLLLVKGYYLLQNRNN